MLLLLSFWDVCDGTELDEEEERGASKKRRRRADDAGMDLDEVDEFAVSFFSPPPSAESFESQVLPVAFFPLLLLSGH